jgi:hypothetical protein
MSVQVCRGYVVVLGGRGEGAECFSGGQASDGTRGSGVPCCGLGCGVQVLVCTMMYMGWSAAFEVSADMRRGYAVGGGCLGNGGESFACGDATDGTGGVGGRVGGFGARLGRGAVGLHAGETFTTKGAEDLGTLVGGESGKCHGSGRE